MQEALKYVDSHVGELEQLIETLCAIPAPSHNEDVRAQFCKNYLESHGAVGVYIDSAKNVVYPVNCEDKKHIRLFMAHTDTVFPDTRPFVPVRQGRRLYCPGVGDNTANLAVLLMVAAYAARRGLKSRKGILFVCNSCEEGLGNLKGCRQIMNDYAGRIEYMVALDGGYDHICKTPVGSSRYRVTVRTEGGHSYAAFGNKNAIYYLASMVNALYSVAVPKKPETTTTYNVGTIAGGTSVNTIAQQAEMLYEYRSNDRECLEQMEHSFFDLVHTYRELGVEVNVELLGTRPCMGDVNLKRQQKLFDDCVQIVERHAGIKPPASSGSTDCNIPLSLGIPAVCFGAYLGQGAHTREEYIELDSLPAGFKIAMELILSQFER